MSTLKMAYGRLGCNAMWFGSWVPMYKNTCCLSLQVEICFLTLNMEVKVLQKLWNACGELHVIS
jgi:hypothetical protein